MVIFCYLILFISQLIRKKRRKQITMVAPVGIFRKAERNSPVIEPAVLTRAEANSCCLKFL